MARRLRKVRSIKTPTGRAKIRSHNDSVGPTEDAIKAAEEVALAAFASGLKIAAAFGTVAAKTTSFALESLATGADRFSDLVKNEALSSPRADTSQASRKKGTRNRRAK